MRLRSPDWQFTPAAQRMLEAAAGWNPVQEHTGELELLAAICAEVECRGATLLAAAGITPDIVCQNWPDLQAPCGDATGDALASTDGGGRRPMGESLNAALRGVRRLLAHHPQPLAMASEHLLLALVDSSGEVGEWLRRRGLATAALVAQIDRLYDCSADASPLPWDEDAPPAKAGVPVSANACAPTAVPAAGVPRRGDHAAVLRIIDAAANRAREGLRVVEDFTRFALNDAFLTEQLKRIRHQLAAALAPLAAELLATRDTPGDVGTAISTPAEFARASGRDVAAANLKRVQESLRSLEEYTKVFDAAAAAQLEQARYRAYTLERAVLNSEAAARRLADVRLCVLVDGGASVADFTRLAEDLTKAGVGAIQLRDKVLDDRAFFERALLLRKITSGTTTRFIVNDRPQHAVLAGSDGLHLGQDDLPLSAARTITGGGMLLGVSTHNIQQARDAVLAGADYLGAGPTFPSGTKDFKRFAGLEYLRAVAAEIALPAFAIGGITLENLGEVLATGVRRVAVSGGIVRHPSPAEAARQFLARLAD